MTTQRQPLTRVDALKELRDCYAAAADCERRWYEARTSGQWAPAAYIQEDIFADLDAYSDRIQELEAFLASEVSA